MVRGRGVGVGLLAALAAVPVAAACSGGGSAAPPPPTRPIATEAPATTAPTTVAPSTSAPSSTAVTATPTTRFDYSKIPVLVKFTPKNDGERELVDEMKRLLVIEHEWLNDPSISEFRLRELLPDREIQAVLQENKERLTAGRYSIPGALDRDVLRSAQRLGPDLGEVFTCSTSSAIAYIRDAEGRTVVRDDSVASSENRYRIRRSAIGWRIEELTPLNEFVGDRCER